MPRKGHIAKRETSPDPVYRPAREGDIRRSEADISLARDLIGYAPKVAIEEGLRRTIGWFRERHAS